MDDLFNNFLNIFINTNEHNYRRRQPQNIINSYVSFDNMFDSFIDEINSTPLTRQHPRNNIQIGTDIDIDMDTDMDIGIDDEEEYDYDHSFRLNQNILHNTRILRQLLLNSHDPAPEREAESVPYNYQTRVLDTVQLFNNNRDTRNDIFPNLNRIQQSQQQWRRRQRHQPPQDPLPLRRFDIEDYNGLFSENVLNMLSTGFNFQQDFTNILLDGLEDEINRFEDIKVTLSHETFNKIIKLENKIEGVCNICLEDFNSNNTDNPDPNIATTDIETTDNNIIVSLKCNHSYHKGCINKWLTEQSTKCPVCRYDCRDNS
jgi:hypothetical protein